LAEEAMSDESRRRVSSFFALITQKAATLVALAEGLQARRGHAPFLDEPIGVAQVDRAPDAVLL
jgi:hypothetical protein